MLVTNANTNRRAVLYRDALRKKLSMSITNLVDHKSNLVNESIEIVPGVEDDENDCHKYTIYYGKDDFGAIILPFQNGPVGEVGLNGITTETLIAIAIDRTKRFQRGKYSCRENAIAITNLEQSLQWFMWRTRGRALRGVEGTHKV